MTVLPFDYTIGGPPQGMAVAASERVVLADVRANEFWWDQPVNDADRRAGGRCATTGIMAPGHSMTLVDGQKHITEFAPTPDVWARSKEPRTR